MADRGPRSFHVMAKPGGSACNLNCAYCYYLSKEDLAGGPGPGRMSDATLELYIRQYIESTTGPEAVFTWQGGEPTLLGIPFFEKVVALQNKYAKPGLRVENDLQTNGTLLDEAWCGFLKANGWLVGLSIDGPRELHDGYRAAKNGKPTFDRVFDAARMLKRRGVPFNTLTCVSRHNARRGKDVYRFLRRELDSTCIQFIPIVEYKGFEGKATHSLDPSSLPLDGSPQARPGSPDSFLTDWSVDTEDYGRFLIEAFDEWRRQDVGKVLVNHFETLVAQHMGLPSQMCVYGEICGRGLAVEHDGTVYACDHYVYPECRAGNIAERPLSEIAFASKQVKFGCDKSDSLPAHCRKCGHLSDCWGECPKNRILRTPEGEAGLNYLCRGLKMFYKHAIPKVDKIVAGLQRDPSRPIARMPRR